MRYFFSFAVVFCTYITFAQHVPFTGNTTPEWHEAIAEFQHMADSSAIAHLATYGKTDVGKPLHLFIINKDRQFFPELFDRKKTVLLINNAIHPGEPDGVDASILFSKELLSNAIGNQSILDSVIICIIPIYNIDGSMIRNGFSRSNQNGPELYGFRGNAQNLDLNRDFIKCDSRNARSFSQLFQAVDPDVFVDTHVSNGADYPYTMTLISTQANKIGPVLGDFIKNSIEPALYRDMKASGYEMIPYVNHMGRTPDSGIADFLETPRFASGYAALFNTIGFITETHMLKPYEQRVEATYFFLVHIGQYMHKENSIILKKRRESIDYFLKQTSYPARFAMDTLHKDQINFKGYEAVYEPALVGNGTRLRYDQSKPYEKAIPYYRHFKPEVLIEVPAYYFVPQAWEEVIKRLELNGVLMYSFENDTTMEVQGYYLNDVKTLEKAYEGHYLHYQVNAREDRMNIRFFAGDKIIPVNQPAIRYILETLDPRTEDSFFAWNFFDGVLQQKEWFSDYVFEEKAQEILNADPELKKRFEEALATDPDMQEHWMQLSWIYRNSPYFEASAFRYPVYHLPRGRAFVR